MFIKNISKILFLLTLSLVTLSLVTFAKAAITNSSRVIPYQGRLTDSSGNNVADGTYAMTFKIYTVSSGGSAAFTESFSAGNAVSVSSGLFSVLLGSLSANGVNLDFANPPYYLGITVGANAEMSPRIQLGFAPLAHNSQYLDGTPLSSFQLNTGVLTGAAGTNTRLQATGTGTGSTGNGSIYFLDSSGNTKGRFDTVSITSATGGTITTSGGYTIHTFTSSGTFTPASTGTVEYLVVGGGGGGGRLYGGGGGAGGFKTGTGFTVTAQAYTITVGAGGTGAQTNIGGNGGSSVFSSITSNGGGGGGYYDGINGLSGASGGGGGGGGSTGGAGTGGQGNSGGNGTTQGAGGGGGSGAVGSNAPGTNQGGNGGSGTTSAISGSSVSYAGGGGGGTESGSTGSGASGGGNGGTRYASGGNATANSGSGGGGGGDQSGAVGGNGGSGIVIIRYPTNSYGTFYLGATNTSSADLAEYYVTGDKSLEAGDVVIVDSDSDRDRGVLHKATKSYDSKLVGVISTNPGVVLGSIDGDTGKSDKRQLALAGRVPVKIDPDSEPINVGDFLTSSSKPGYAKKATESGYVIGKALENWSGQSSIEVFINLIYKQEKSEFEEMKRLICLDHPDSKLCK